MPLKNKTNSKRKTPGKNTELTQFIKIQIYALVAYIFFFIIFSMISLAADLSKDYVYFVALALFVFSSFTVGFVSGIKLRKRGLLTGILYALPMNSFFILISLITNGFQADLRLLPTAVAMIMASGAGGIVSVNMKIKK